MALCVGRVGKTSCRALQTPAHTQYCSGNRPTIIHKYSLKGDNLRIRLFYSNTRQIPVRQKPFYCNHWKKMDFLSICLEVLHGSSMQSWVTDADVYYFLKGLYAFLRGRELPKIWDSGWWNFIWALLEAGEESGVIEKWCVCSVSHPGLLCVLVSASRRLCWKQSL